MIRETLKRQLVVVGACTGTDAHTVGLDAILSMKGFAGDNGLEYFAEMRVINLGLAGDAGGGRQTSYATSGPMRYSSPRS